jgi:hypothetical protein
MSLDRKMFVINTATNTMLLLNNGSFQSVVGKFYEIAQQLKNLSEQIVLFRTAIVNKANYARTASADISKEELQTKIQDLLIGWKKVALIKNTLLPLPSIPENFKKAQDLLNNEIVISHQIIDKNISIFDSTPDIKAEVEDTCSMFIKSKEQYKEASNFIEQTTLKYNAAHKLTEEVCKELKGACIIIQKAIDKAPSQNLLNNNSSQVASQAKQVSSKGQAPICVQPSNAVLPTSVIVVPDYSEQKINNSSAIAMALIQHAPIAHDQRAAPATPTIVHIHSQPGKNSPSNSISKISSGNSSIQENANGIGYYNGGASLFSARQEPLPSTSAKVHPAHSAPPPIEIEEKPKKRWLCC